MTRWWQDPDLGRDRTTKALGRRDWNWFTPYADGTGVGTAPSDIESGQSPWAPHPVTPHDRHDRTLGIPPRHTSMWPPQHPILDRARGTPADRLAAILDDLRRLPQPQPTLSLPVGQLAEALTDLAAHLYARAEHVQAAITAAVARRHGLDPTELGRLATDIGEMITKTTHRSARGQPGDARLNALATANVPLAAEIYIARARLAWAAAYSDPDLPRLWILANGLVHHIPASVMLTVPARSVGPIARLRPLHDDLVGWYGIRRTVEHLDATLDAARAGQRWLTTAADTDANRLVALGVLDLTHPAAAHQLADRRPGPANIGKISALLARQRPPATIADLSDPALKAACDRNGWLTGTADERTDRELVERRSLATDLADVAPVQDAGEIAEQLVREAPDDTTLDNATWRGRPPSPDAVQRRALLNAASREALRRFAGLDIEQRPSRAVALAARYPDRLARHVLRIPAADLVTDVQPLLAATVPPPQIELDLGL